MGLLVFDAEDYRSDIADWAELFALSDPFGRVSSSQFNRARSILEDEDHEETDYDGAVDAVVDAEIAQLEEEERALLVLSEFNFRQRVLGDLYPFSISTEADGWTLELRRSCATPQTAAGRVAYLACLVISGLRSDVIETGEDDEDAKKFRKKAPAVLQVLACVAAAELVNGTAYWMGWPREDRKTRLRDALERLVERIGYGQLKDQDPEWTTGHEKDGTVDVVAWRSFPDNYWAGPVVFGQVASGNNWTTKSVRTQLASHFFDWFVEAPGEPEMTSLAAMFIPFPVHQSVKENRRGSFETRAVGTSRRYAKEFGLVIDRNRLTQLIASRYAVRSVDQYIQSYSADILRWLKEGRRFVSA